MSNRDFRTADSYAAECVTRDMLPEYLRNRGFHDVRDDRYRHGNTQSQTIQTTAPDGQRFAMRVRLCWRRASQGPQKYTYSAAQILSEVRNDDWEGALQAKIDRERADGISHFLIVQREGDEIAYAALVPLSELVAIWCAQRDISQALAEQGKISRRRKNHAMNGSSPTLWLRDDRAPQVGAALWNHVGVQDLAVLEIVTPNGIPNSSCDDTFDDMPAIDYSSLGSDGAPVVVRLRSCVKRDQRVRIVVLQRAEGRCEREECGATRPYPGFLDVHHILGTKKSDRVWNCVALCPNCHREAHVAPNQDQVNEGLLAMATRFRNSTSSGKP